jgi:leukotriene-A4 hydrolase
MVCMNASRAVWRLLLIALLVPLTIEARQRAVFTPFTPPPPHDVFSASEPSEVRTYHLALDLEVDFQARQMRGAATHSIINITGTHTFIVDTRSLSIHSVSIDGAPTTWSLGAETPAGRALTIDIEPTTREVRIDYATAPAAKVLHWLTALQTTGGVSPFLYTFSQPDHTREWIPLQDSPGVRMTYEATVRVPPGLLALMSARNPREPAADGVYRFEMPYPIAPYLIALAVGRLEFHALSDRTGFYAEPEWVDDASWDLQFVPAMLDTAEQILGPYPFERYDILLAPPGFSAGGMENPMCNFINVVAAVSSNHESPPTPQEVVAHELSHSWAGDLTTCATWSDTWLNEGFATYYAKRILEVVQGSERADLGFYWDRQAYEDYVRQLTNTPGFTVLHHQFQASDSLSIFNPTSYQKGSIFLKMLEDKAGRPVFDDFIRSYFQRYAFRWVDERAFLDELKTFVAVDQPLRLDDWIYGTGLPGNVTAPTRSVLWDRIEVEAKRFRAGTRASSLNTGGWKQFELGLFLQMVTDIVPQHMAELDATFGLSALKTPSIHWFLGVATTLYPPGLPMFERFLFIGGPNVRSVYYRLAQTPAGLAYALAIYQRARERYEPDIQAYVDQVLGVHISALPIAA